jgi:hypothetical protein
MGTPEEGQRFFDDRWPEARAVSDPEKSLYQELGLARGKPGQFFGLSVLRAGLRARRDGHSVGKVVGDPWMMPGWFLVKDSKIAWSFRGQHAGDHPDYDDVAATARALRED